MKPALRAALTALGVVLAALAGIGVRDARLSGLFAHVTLGFAGSCRAITGIAGAGDLQIDAQDGLVFIAARRGRRPDARDGIYTMTLAGEGLARLAGAPADFHPRAISIGRGPDGVLTLFAINDRASGRPAIDIFDVTVAGGTAKLAQRSSVEGGLIAHPSAIAATGSNSFYVANETTSRTVIGRALETYVMLPRGNVVYFAGGGLRVVADGLGRPEGLALSPDGGHLVVATMSARALVTYGSNLFSGSLEPAGTLVLPAGPDKITIDSQGLLWVAGHPNLFALAAYARDGFVRAPSQLFRVDISGGIPQSAEPVYGDDGSGIGAASVGAASGGRLVIGSALDDRILDCNLK